jgi:very-short-patch-repair endonuclease
MAVDREAQARLAALARAQNGNATWQQLPDLALSKATVDHRVATKIWHRLHRGVYCLGDPDLIPRARESGALLAVGDGAVISHASAAAVWGISEHRPDPVEITLIGRQARPRPGIDIHYASLDRRDVTTRHQLAVTSPARTIIDLARTLTASQLDPFLDAVLIRRLATEDSIRQTLERTPDNHSGAAIVRACLGHTGLTRSEAERRLRALLKAAELPQPLVNQYLAGLLVDFYWPEAGLVLEVDGFRFHGSRAAFERDRRRDQRLAAAGFQVIRITWRQLEEEPMAVLARLAQALALRAA